MKKELTFQGTVIWQGREHIVAIFLTESADALIGSGLFEGLERTIGYARRVVTIIPDVVPDSNKRKKRKSKK